MVFTRNSMGGKNEIKDDAIEQKIEDMYAKVVDIDKKLKLDEKSCASIQEGYERLLKEWEKKCEVEKVDYAELKKKYKKTCEEAIELKGKLAEQNGTCDSLKVEMQQAVHHLEITIESMNAEKEKLKDEHAVEIKILNEQLIKKKEERKLDCKSGVPKEDYNALVDEYEMMKGKYSNLKEECIAMKTKIDQINFSKKQVEKGKLDVIREKNATTSYFLKKVQGLEDRVKYLEKENLSLKSSATEDRHNPRYSPDNRRRHSPHSPRRNPFSKSFENDQSKKFRRV